MYIYVHIYVHISIFSCDVTLKASTKHQRLLLILNNHIKFFFLVSYKNFLFSNFQTLIQNKYYEVGLYTYICLYCMYVCILLYCLQQYYIPSAFNLVLRRIMPVDFLKWVLNWINFQITSITFPLDLQPSINQPIAIPKQIKINI